MKNKRIIFRVVAIVALLAVFATCTALLAACNKNKTKSITDIFKTRASYGELTRSVQEFVLPAGWEVYTNSATSSSGSASQNSDVGYIPELDAFVVGLKVNSAYKLSIVKCGDDTDYKNGMKNGMMFTEQQGIRALRYKDGLIVCLFDDGTAGAFDAATGREVISRRKLGKDVTGENNGNTGYNDTAGGSIDSIIKILCGGLIAVHYNYAHGGSAGYTSIFRPTYTGSKDERGEEVCRVRNESNSLAQLNGFDNKYVSVSGTSNGEYIFRIPDHAPAEGAQNVEATSKGSYTTNSKSGYTDESTYLGGGKFYVSQEWEVSSDEDYTYYNGSKYIKCNRGIYNADRDSFDEYNGGVVFNKMTNNYYDSSKAGLDTNAYLKDGYTYVSFGLTVYEANGKKLGLYDQFILDSDLNVVMSLTGNYGVHIDGQTKEKVSFYDLIMFGVDGYFYVPMQPSQINIFDGNGDIVGHNDRETVTRQELNSNIMVAQMPGESSSTSLYGAYDIHGELIVPFEYDQLASFRGPYTIGRRYGKKEIEDESTGTRYLRLIGPNGQEITEAQMCDINNNITTDKPFSDIAYSSTSSESVTYAIYKTGCYMFRVDSGKRNSNNAIIYNYGVRNFDPNFKDSVIIDAHMAAGSILYSPTESPSDVFVFEKITGETTSDVTYIIYRLV